MVFDAISSKLDKVVSIKSSGNAFIYGDIKGWLAYSGGTDRPAELRYNSVIILSDLAQLVNFPAWIPDCDSHSPALLDFFLSSEAGVLINVLINILLSSVLINMYPNFLPLFCLHWH